MFSDVIAIILTHSLHVNISALTLGDILIKISSSRATQSHYLYKIHKTLI